MAKKLSGRAVARYLDETAPECLVQNKRPIARMHELASMARNGMSTAAIIEILRGEAPLWLDERARLVYRQAADDIEAGRV